MINKNRKYDNEHLNESVKPTKKLAHCLSLRRKQHNQNYNCEEELKKKPIIICSNLVSTH